MSSRSTLVSAIRIPVTEQLRRSVLEAVKAATDAGVTLEFGAPGRLPA